MDKPEVSHKLDKLFQDYKSQMEESQKRIDEAWEEIGRRRKKVSVVMLVFWFALCGLGYYLFKM